MAERIVMVARDLPRGHVAAVIGNNLAHAERLVVLVHSIAKQHGVDVSHIIFKPVGGDEITAEALDVATTREKH